MPRRGSRVQISSPAPNRPPVTPDWLRRSGAKAPIKAALPRRGTQVVRERSAKPLCGGSIPPRASKPFQQLKRNCIEGQLHPCGDFCWDYLHFAPTSILRCVMADCLSKAAICCSALSRSSCSTAFRLVLLSRLSIAKDHRDSGVSEHCRM